MKSKIEINPKFKEALSIMEDTSKSIFLTGKAGTGKSALLKHFIETSRKKVVILAPTGVAALNVDGVTIHSFFRFSPNMTKEDVQRRAKSLKKKDIYRRIETIVIDEISMVRADMLDLIDIFLRIVLGKKEAFGGIQMVFVGDLYQLPPVVKREEREFFRVEYESPYFFSSNVIKDACLLLEFVELEKIYRQEDKNFIGLLNSIRNNSITDEEIDIFNDRVCEDFGDKEYISLTTTNKAAHFINEKYLKELESKTYTFKADINGKFKASGYPTNPDLILKEGAKIMLLNNDSMGEWVNGSIGRIVEINDNEEYLVVVLDNGKQVTVEPHKWEVKKYVYNRDAGILDKEKIGSFKQYPCRLSWAITIHKSQGKTFEKIIIDLGTGSFAHGQTYVALSRCSTFDGIVLKQPLRKSSVIMDYRVKDFMNEYQ